jgi:hypothetical protein
MCSVQESVTSCLGRRASNDDLWQQQAGANITAVTTAVTTRAKGCSKLVLPAERALSGCSGARFPGAMRGNDAKHKAQSSSRGGMD